MAPPRRLLVSVSPRVLSDALRELLLADRVGEVVQVEPGVAAPGRFDLALVSGATPVDAGVVVELLDSGGCVVIHHADGDRIIELRDAAGLIDVVVEHLGVVPPVVVEG